MYSFDWDDQKNILNQLKHNVSFEEATTVFLDENALLKTDKDHSYDEERFIILGFSMFANLLVVVHCYRDDDEIIRIISARKATRREERQYEKETGS
jgi:hypothetical protein